MTSPVVLCVRRTDAPTHTHTGAASAILANLVCMTCHWWTRGASISQDLGWPHFLLQQGAWRIYWRSYSHSPPGKKRTDSNHRQIQRRVSVCLVCLGLFHWLQLNWCLATGCMMTSRLHQETKVSCWSMPPELSGVQVPMMRLKTIQKGIQVPLGSEFEMG